ncbi:MAG: hypothetical protein WA851_06375 [Xanthobacteraceae bacterium]
MKAIFGFAVARAAEDDVVAAFDVKIGGGFDLGGIVGNALHKRNSGVELLFHFHARFFDRLLPTAVIFGVEIDPGDFRGPSSVKALAGGPANANKAPATTNARPNIFAALPILILPTSASAVVARAGALTRKMF